MIDFIKIINNEVPIAVFIFNPAKITNVGIIIKPPPAPTIPVKRPTSEPCRIILKFLYIKFEDTIDNFSLENN